MTVDEVRSLLVAAGLVLKDEADLPNGTGHRLRLTNGAVVNVFNNGNFNVQGKHQSEVNAALAASKEGAASDAAGKRIFVVHGQDAASREQLELILHRLGLEPFVLANTGGGGLTIIEALEQEIGKQGGPRFGIVLMTPDDVGYFRQDGPDKAQPRARQNVVMEMGMLIAALGRSRVAILKKGPLEIPSNADGILYLSFSNHVREAVPKLVDRLQSAGFALEAGRIANAAS
jgi:predicted nucleotide-binding protein